MMKFIELNEDKSPKTKFDVTYTSADNLENAGLLLNNNIVIADFDNDNENEGKIIDFILKTYPTLNVKTNRGIHLYYSIPKGVNIKKRADQITVGGFQVDYLTGEKAYAIIKQRGIFREASGPLDLDNLIELPDILYPLPKSKTTIPCMIDGEGRNSTLFHHLRDVLNLYKEIKIEEVASFISNIIFSDPLSEKEINSILGSVPNYVTYNGNPKDMIAFAKHMVDKLDIKLYNNILYFKDNVRYSNNQNKLKRAMSKHLELKTTQDNEAISQMYKYAEYIEDNSAYNFKIRLQNGIIEENKVTNRECGFTPYYLDVNYDPNAYDKNVDDFLNFICCNNNDMRLVIEEILGHCLLIKRFPHKMFFLVGKGANGKSTFVEMITRWVGDLASHIDISSFDDGTSLISLIGKIVNISDDVDAVYLEKSKNLKTMASGNTVGARAIYSQPIALRNTATLIFTANEPPVFKDKTDGITRRLMIIPFDNVVKKREIDLDDKLSTDNAKSYLLNLALEGSNRLYNNGLEFSKSEIIENTTKEYQIDNDTVLSFINSYSLEYRILGKPFQQVYNDYLKYTESLNQKPVSSNKFSRRLKDKGYICVVQNLNGISTRVITQK